MSALSGCQLVLINLKGNWGFDIGAQELCGAAIDYTQTMEQKDLKMSIVLYKAFSPTIFHTVKKAGRWFSR